MNEEYINSLVWWAYQKNYTVIFDKDCDNSMCPESKTILIKNTNSLESQLFTLLHECGHVLIFENKSVFNFREIQSKNSKRSSTSKVFTVVEEAEAWKRGRLLANRLCIEVDEEKWNKATARALKKYMKWCLDLPF